MCSCLHLPPAVPVACCTSNAWKRDLNQDRWSKSIFQAFIVWQPRRAADMSRNWRQSLLHCCTASMEQAADGAETAAIDRLVLPWFENISVSFCLRAPQYGLTLWCALGLLVGGAIQVRQLQFLGSPLPLWLCGIWPLWLTWPKLGHSFACKWKQLSQANSLQLNWDDH